MHSVSHTLSILTGILVVGANWACADVFELRDGGRIAGKLIERGEKGQYVVETTEAAVLTLTRKQVQRVVAQDEKHLEYIKLSRSLPDTADAHRMLIDWCKEAKLRKQADHHRKRLLELDPNDQQVRTSLGFQHRNGRWMTQNEMMAERGLVRFDGDYRTPQDIALRKHKKKQKEVEAEWKRNVRQWRDWLDSRRSAEATQLLAEINDPNAAFALASAIEKERDQQVRELLIEILAKLQHPLAVTTLVDLSLNDPDRNLRLQCIDYLNQYHQPISLIPYVKKLQHRDNLMVNRAAEALQEIRNPDAISPLIDALVTTHQYKNNGAPPGDISASFSRDGSGGGGLSMGGTPKIRKVNQKNLEVRTALVELSGAMDFEYDEKAWRRWYINQQIQDFVDTRRDK